MILSRTSLPSPFATVVHSQRHHSYVGTVPALVGSVDEYLISSLLPFFVLALHPHISSLLAALLPRLKLHHPRRPLLMQDSMAALQTPQRIGSLERHVCRAVAARVGHGLLEREVRWLVCRGGSDGCGLD